MNSRSKGARGERELAGILRAFGFDAKRDGQQGNGDASDHADVVGIDGLHIECKRVERLNIDAAMEQSIRDARCDEVPVVMHRKNGKPWLVTMGIGDFADIWRFAEAER